MTEHEKQELCVAYFRQNHAYDRAFQMMRKKRNFSKHCQTKQKLHMEIPANAAHGCPE